MTTHSYYKGEPELLGQLIYRDYICKCGIIRRTVLNNNNKEEIEHYELNEEIMFYEPDCTFKKRKKYKKQKTHPFECVTLLTT